MGKGARYKCERITHEATIGISPKSRVGRKGVPTTLKVLICENPQGSHM